MMIKSRVVIAHLLSLVLLLSVANVYPQSTSQKPPAVLATTIPARVIADPSVRAGWRRYGFGEGPGFSVILPAEPVVTSEGVQTQILNTYIAATSYGVYAAARVDRIPVHMESAPEEVRSRYFREYFQGFAKGMEKALASTGQSVQLQEVTRVATTTGRNGFQQRFALGSMQGRAQMVFVGNSAFCIIAVWTPATPANDDESFFSSFRITTVAN
jgi:hypothetical protein